MTQHDTLNAVVRCEAAAHRRRAKPGWRAVGEKSERHQKTMCGYSAKPPIDGYMTDRKASNDVPAARNDNGPRRPPPRASRPPDPMDTHAAERAAATPTRHRLRPMERQQSGLGTPTRNLLPAHNRFVPGPCGTTELLRCAEFVAAANDEGRGDPLM